MVVLTSTVVAAALIAFLYWAKSLLIPIVLAVFLTFVLSPAVTFLHRRGVWRIPAVIMVVFLTASILVGGLWLFTSEISNLLGELPKYSANITQKIKSLRQFTSGGVADGVEKMIRDVGQELKPKSAKPDGSHSEGSLSDGSLSDGPPSDGSPEARSKVVVVKPEAGAKSEATNWLSWLPSLLGSLMDLLGGMALALVLVLFMLARREDLRNRLIRLVGHGRVTVTTKAVDDAGQRISRFLLVQLIVNAVYGLTLRWACLPSGWNRLFCGAFSRRH